MRRGPCNRLNGFQILWTRIRWVVRIGLMLAPGYVVAQEDARLASPALQGPKRTALADAAEVQDWGTLRLLLAEADSPSYAQPDGMTALHWAAFHDEVDSITRLIEAKLKVDQATHYGVTPLSIACTLGHAGAAKRLIQDGADWRWCGAGGESLMMLAARSGSLELVKTLLEKQWDLEHSDAEGQKALMWAAAEGHADIVELLVNAGAKVEAATPKGWTALLFAARDGRMEAVHRLIDLGADVHRVIPSKASGERAARAGTSALILAVESGHFEIALKLVEAGADPNDQRSGFAPLHVLSWVRKPNSGDDPSGDPPPRGSGSLSDLEFVRKLVEAGADINRRLERGEGGQAVLNPRGAPPFLYAARTADLPLMQTFIELNADPSLTNVDGCTALMAAAGIGVRAVDEEAGTEPEVLAAIDYLVQLGLDVNSVDQNLETAMHGAAYRCFPKVVRRLAELGSHSSVWNHKNKYGWTPFRIAEGYRPGSFKPSPETMEALQDVQ